MGTDWSRPTWTCPPELSLPTSMVWGLQVNPPRSCCLLPTVSVNFHLPAHGLSSFPSPSQSRSFPPMKSSPFQIHPWSIPANRALVAPPRAQSCLLVCFFTSPAAIDSSFFFFFQRGEKMMANWAEREALHSRRCTCICWPHVWVSALTEATPAAVSSPRSGVWLPVLQGSPDVLQLGSEVLCERSLEEPSRGLQPWPGSCSPARALHLDPLFPHPTTTVCPSLAQTQAQLPSRAQPRQTSLKS